MHEQGGSGTNPRCSTHLEAKWAAFLTAHQSSQVEGEGQGWAAPYYGLGEPLQKLTVGAGGT